MIELLHDVLDWLPVVMSAVCGFLAGHYYARYRGTGAHLNAVLYILYKQHRGGTQFTPAENIVIQAAVDHLMSRRSGR